MTASPFREFDDIAACENKNRNETLRYVGSSKRLGRWARLVDSSLVALREVSCTFGATDGREVALQYLVTQVLSSAAASLSTLLAGYYQQSAILQRHILEVGFLLDYFLSNPSRIEEWRTHKEEWLPPGFGTGKIIAALDKRDRLTVSNRRETYVQLVCPRHTIQHAHDSPGRMLHGGTFPRSPVPGSRLGRAHPESTLLHLGLGGPVSGRLADAPPVHRGFSGRATLMATRLLRWISDTPSEGRGLARGVRDQVLGPQAQEAAATQHTRRQPGTPLCTLDMRFTPAHAVRDRIRTPPGPDARWKGRNSIRDCLVARSASE
jgi:hypothetical protein